MLENTVTPRVFIAATRQNDGKTTASLGLLGALRKRFPRVGYIKPVGQRYVNVNGMKIDEDTVLINDTYHPDLPLEAMSPIAVEPNFTRDYLDRGNPAELRARVETAFNRAAWEQDFIVIEGSGHAGVGSVFDMSNARVAEILRSRVVIVSRGGVGAPIDEISLNLALFKQHRIPVVGVILNKVLPARLAELRPYAEKGLAKLGLPLLGIIPLDNELRKPTINQIAVELGGRFLAGEKGKRRRVNRVHIATVTAKNVETFLLPGNLLIVAGDREDIVLAVLSANCDDRRLAGVILTHGLEPQPDILRVMQAHNVPFIAVKQDAYETAAAITDMTVKTEPGDKEKITLIQKLIEEHVNIDAIITAAMK